MAKISNNFKFVGKFKSIKDGIREIESKNNPSWKGKEIAFNIVTETGTQRVLLFGGEDKTKPIKTFSKTKNEDGKIVKLEIPYSKRLDPKVIEEVANFKKIKIGDNVFITEYDAINFIEENILELEGKPIIVTGQVKFDVYNSKIYTKYYMNNIYTELKDDVKEGFTGQLALFITPDTISEDYKKGKDINYSLVEKERVIVFNTYIEEYNSDKSTREEVPYLYIPVQTCIKLKDKFDFNNPDHMKQLKFRVENLVVKKGIYEIGMNCEFIRGAEKEDIKYEDLTTWEKSRIESGDTTFEEIVKSKQGYGEFTEEIQLKTFHSKYDEGLIKTELVEDDLIDLTVEEVKEEVKEEMSSKMEDVDDDDLF